MKKQKEKTLSLFYLEKDFIERGFRLIKELV